MEAFKSKTLNKLHKATGKANKQVTVMQSYAPTYFAELRHYIPLVMASIVDEDSRDTCIKLMQRILHAQYELMGLKIIANVSIDDDLWEIAEDFDNDDPNRYDYLIKKIKNKEYLIQKADTVEHS